MLNDLYLLNPVFLDDIATTVSEKAGETTIPISDIPDAIRNFPKEKINSGIIKSSIDCNTIALNINNIKPGFVRSAVDCTTIILNPNINSGFVKNIIDCNTNSLNVTINKGKITTAITLLEG